MTEEERDNISKMIRSSSFHETGVQLAESFNYPSFNMLLDLLHYYTLKPTTEAYYSKTNHYLAAYLANFVFSNCIHVVVHWSVIKGVELKITNRKSTITTVICDRAMSLSFMGLSDLDYLIESRVMLLEDEIKEHIKNTTA